MLFPDVLLTCQPPITSNALDPETLAVPRSMPLPVLPLLTAQASNHRSVFLGDPTTTIYKRTWARCTPCPLDYA